MDLPRVLRLGGGDSSYFISFSDREASLTDYYFGGCTWLSSSESETMMGSSLSLLLFFSFFFLLTGRLLLCSASANYMGLLFLSGGSPIFDLLF